jgi:hypothetical protein
MTNARRKLEVRRIGVEGNHNFLCQLTLHSIINLKGRIGARIGLDNLSEEHFFCWMLILSFTTAF